MRVLTVADMHPPQSIGGYEHPRDGENCPLMGERFDVAVEHELPRAAGGA